MSAALALVEALDRGARVLWDPPVRPRLLVPRDCGPLRRPTGRRCGPSWSGLPCSGSRPNGSSVRAAASRSWRSPRLRAPMEAACPAGRTHGEGRHFRCPLCVVAVRIALDISPVSEETTP